MVRIIEDAANAENENEYENTFFTPQHVVGATALSVTYNELRESLQQQVSTIPPASWDHRDSNQWNITARGPDITLLGNVAHTLHTRLTRLQVGRTCK